MKPMEQQIAIAKARGRIGPFEIVKRWCEPVDTCAYEADVLIDGSGDVVPDYPGDLNAIAAAEHALLNGIIAEQHYATALYRTMNEPSRYCEIVYRATAAQRTEALVRFLGLWRDAP